MKVLVIEDENFKLDTVTRVLTECQVTKVKFVYTDNLNDAILEVQKQTIRNKFDLIILDMDFFRTPCNCKRAIAPLPFAGSMFLQMLALRNIKIPTIIYYSGLDYKEKLRGFIVPKFIDFCETMDSHPISLPGSMVDKRYNEICEEYKRIVRNLSFIQGQAQNEDELRALFRAFYKHFCRKAS